MRHAVFWLCFILCQLAVQAYYFKHEILPTQEIQGEEGSKASQALLDYLLPEEGLQRAKEPTVIYFCKKCFCLGGLMSICTWRNCEDWGLLGKVLDAVFNKQAPDDLLDAWVYESKCDNNVKNEMGALNGKFNTLKTISGGIQKLSTSFLRGRVDCGGKKKCDDRCSGSNCGKGKCNGSNCGNSNGCRGNNCENSGGGKGGNGKGGEGHGGDGGDGGCGSGNCGGGGGDGGDGEGGDGFGGEGGRGVGGGDGGSGKGGDGFGGQGGRGVQGGKGGRGKGGDGRGGGGGGGWSISLSGGWDRKNGGGGFSSGTGNNFINLVSNDFALV